jgi:intracellular sulfur oxidation DsrE/DsrF family protein
MRLFNAAIGTLMVGLVSMPAFAQGGNTECPVGLVNGLSLDDEFGPGTQQLTRCLAKRAQVKMVVQIHQLCANGAATCTNPYALGNIRNILDDYEITHGMTAGRDYEVVAVLHGSGGRMALKNNPFESQVQGLMARGVKFYFCQNTTRGFIRGGILPNFQTTGQSATEQLIDGMQYTTAGLTSIADFEAAGYQYIQP